MPGHLDKLSALLLQLAAAPQDGRIWCEVGFTYLQIFEIQEALATFISARQLAPQLAAAHYGESIARFQFGDHAGAMACLETAMQLAPAEQSLFSAHAHLCAASDQPPPVVFAAYRAWAERFAEPLRPHRRPARRQRCAGERVRIGYLSADLRQHALLSFFAPVLERHDRQRFSLIAFSSGRADPLTTEIRRRFDDWHDIGQLSDHAAADLIRQQEIDILVDLSGHTDGSRLLTLARQPAAVQFTWYGYNSTTGSRSIDYRLTDASMDPPGNEQWSTETLLRLPAFAAYAPPAEAPPVATLPADRQGYVTFGSLNNPQKLTGATLAAWAAILRRLPTARLLLIGPHAPSAVPGVGAQLRQRLAASGLPTERVELLPRQDFPAFLQLGERVDIALEPFPLSGAVTTCHALWMGAIPITLSGILPNTRAAAAILCAAGLPELIAADRDAYVELACQLATDHRRLRQLRAGLREHLAASRLLDHGGHVRALEEAYLLALNESPAPCP